MSDEPDSNNPSDNTEAQALPNVPSQSTVAKTEILTNLKNKSGDDQDTTRELRREFRWFEMASLFVQGVLAIIGIWALCIYSGQLDVMRGQLTQMNATLSQMKEQTKAAHISAVGNLVSGVASSAQADISQKALNSTIAISQQDRRAWVGVVGVITQRPHIEGDTFSVQSVKITIRNSGRTPALEMSFNCCLEGMIPNHGSIPDYDSRAVEDEVQDRKLELEMRSRHEALLKTHPERAAEFARTEKEFGVGSAERKMPVLEGAVLAPDVPQELEVVPVGQSWGTVNKHPLFSGGPEVREYFTIYILGKITYRDVFTGTTKRSTKFCLMRFNEPSFTICPTGNWMD